ncbi:MAG: CDIF630_02480 family spore surface protein [Halanaerobiales bacterium]
MAEYDDFPEDLLENHMTAAWINNQDFRGQARVFYPTDLGVEQAKEYVDENQI